MRKVDSNMRMIHYERPVKTNVNINVEASSLWAYHQNEGKMSNNKA